MANNSQRLPEDEQSTMDLVDAFMDVIITISDALKMLAARVKNRNALRRDELTEQRDREEKGDQ